MAAPAGAAVLRPHGRHTRSRHSPLSARKYPSPTEIAKALDHSAPARTTWP